MLIAIWLAGQHLLVGLAICWLELGSGIRLARPRRAALRIAIVYLLLPFIILPPLRIL